MAETALRSIKDLLGPRAEVQTADIKALNVTTATIAADAVTGAKIADDAVDSEHLADGSVDLVHEANQAKADSIVLFDTGFALPTERLNNTRIFTNYTDRKLIFAAFDLVCGEKLSVNSGSTVFFSLDAGTTALASINRTASLAAGTTTALTNASQLSLASGASMRCRESALTVGGPGRFTKIIGHYRAAAV